MNVPGTEPRGPNTGGSGDGELGQAMVQVQRDLGDDQSACWSVGSDSSHSQGVQNTSISLFSRDISSPAGGCPREGAGVSESVASASASLRDGAIDMDVAVESDGCGRTVSDGESQAPALWWDGGANPMIQCDPMAHSEHSDDVWTHEDEAFERDVGGRCVGCCSPNSNSADEQVSDMSDSQSQAGSSQCALCWESAPGQQADDGGAGMQSEKPQSTDSQPKASQR
jgi:hypothetical protein